MRKNCRLGCFLDASRPDAGCADTNVLAHAVNHSVDALQVWIPAAAAGIIRVADDIAETRSLTAKCASLCHNDSSPILLKLSRVSSLAEFTLIRTSFGCETILKRQVVQKVGNFTASGNHSTKLSSRACSS